MAEIGLEIRPAETLIAPLALPGDCYLPLAVQPDKVEVMVRAHQVPTAPRRAGNAPAALARRTHSRQAASNGSPR